VPRNPLPGRGIPTSHPLLPGVAGAWLLPTLQNRPPDILQPRGSPRRVGEAVPDSSPAGTVIVGHGPRARTEGGLFRTARASGFIRDAARSALRRSRPAALCPSSISISLAAWMYPSASNVSRITRRHLMRRFGEAVVIFPSSPAWDGWVCIPFFIPLGTLLELGRLRLSTR
jgi:hypothetical protein